MMVALRNCSLITSRSDLALHDQTLVYSHAEFIFYWMLKVYCCTSMKAAPCTITSLDSTGLENRNKCMSNWISGRKALNNTESVQYMWIEKFSVFKYFWMTGRYPKIKNTKNFDNKRTKQWDNVCHLMLTVHCSSVFFNVSSYDVE